MIVHSQSTLLYIEPKGLPAVEPVIDEITRKMTAAFRKHMKKGLLENDGTFLEDEMSRGWHTCCGEANSTNCDYMLPNGIVTNSLAMHYLAHHRNEVLESVIEIVKGFQYGEEIPTKDELNGRVMPRDQSFSR